MHDYKVSFFLELLFPQMPPFGEIVPNHSICHSHLVLPSYYLFYILYYHRIFKHINSRKSNNIMKVPGTLLIFINYQYFPILFYLSPAPIHIFFLKYFKGNFRYAILPMKNSVCISNI